MSIKEEVYVVFEDNCIECEFVAGDMVKNNVSEGDSRTLSKKVFEGNSVKKKLLVPEVKTNLSKGKMTDINYFLTDALNCSACQNVCSKCKSKCATCKSECKKCHSRDNNKNSSTDTDDFDKYLETQYKKIKVQPKVKTVGTDTCDLEGHFDYYKLDKKIIRIQKDACTDCTGLNVRKISVKKTCKNTVATDTSDLESNEMRVQFDDSDCEFYWVKKEEKTYFRNNSEENLFSNNNNCKNDVKNIPILNEKNCLLPTLKEEEDNKENYNIDNNSRDITFDSSSTSDESDIDLMTSSKLSKCRQLAKKYKIKLKQINKASEILFQCCICEKTFPKKHLSILHLGSHIQNNKFACLICNEQFISLNLLSAHVKDSHSNKTSTDNKSSNDLIPNFNREDFNSKAQKQKNNKIYQCVLCSNENDSLMQFDSYKALYLHKKIKHGISRPKFGENNRTEKKLRIKREFICLMCGKQFKSSKALKDHSPVHTGEKNYHCDICKKSYTTSANLKIHKRTHTGTRNFVCTVCNKAFHKKDSLKVHFRKHSGERPFQCDLCPMKFDRNYILKNHRFTHFSEKTFICPVCGKTFTTHGGLNNHEKVHKKDPFAKKPRKPAVKPTLETENAVICDVCGKIYSTRSNLRIHKFVHLGVKPFECTICHQTYAKKDSMLTHMRKHTDERPFACETCGMTFYRNHTLKTHLLRHTGERPHKCKMCGKSFTQSSSLAYHVKNHDRKTEKKKSISTDPLKVKKKRVGSRGAAKKVAKLSKSDEILLAENNKSSFEEKKFSEETSEITVIKDGVPLNLPDKVSVDLSKGGQYMLPIPEKEILILDKNLTVELPRNINSVKEIDFLGVEKDGIYNPQYNLSKFNYYLTKGHVFSFPKDTAKTRLEKNNDNVENLIVSKNSYITKEGTLVTINRDSSLKNIKEEFVEIDDQRLTLKGEAPVPITGEILNAGFISDEHGDVVPFSSMALQGLSTENVMIGPIISVETNDRKGLLRDSKLTIADSKITENLAAPHLSSNKCSKGNCHVISLKDPRITQKIHIELESASLQIQAPLVEDNTLQGISGFYSNVQQNEI